MNIITISRECGAGGGELGRMLAGALGWEFLHRELIHEAAQIEGVPDSELERLDEKAISAADRLRRHPPHQTYLRGLKAAVEEAAQRGNVVLVGRGRRYLLGEMPNALHLRLVAPRDWRARRIGRLEELSFDQALVRLIEVDRGRDRFHRYFFGSKSGEPCEYHLVVNTARFLLEDVASIVAAIVQPDRNGATARCSGRRVLTLARELGAGEQVLPRALGDRLQMRVFDRELLEEQAVRLGVPASELEKIDEQAPGIFQRFRPGSTYQRYRDALERSMHELAAGGDVLIVGRGGSRFLHDDPRAFHVRLVAPMSVRIRRVMEYHWVREDVAKKRISESDTARHGFYQDYFGADWADPVEYDATVNSGWLGTTAVDLIALAADRHWNRAP